MTDGHNIHCLLIRQVTFFVQTLLIQNGLPDLHLLVVISASPEQLSRILHCPTISDWTSALHLFLDIQNDPPSFTCALIISVSVALLCISSFPGQKFQLHYPSFLHIPLFLIQYHLPFLFLNPVLFKFGSQSSSSSLCWKLAGNANSCVLSQAN